MCGDEDSGVVMRGVVCLRCVVGVQDGALLARVKEEVRKKGGLDVLRGLASGKRGVEVKEVARETLSILEE
jgi:hypothetical protein